MAVIARDNVTGLIYAGGRATRMGGVDKGLELFRGRPLIEAVIDRLKPQCASIVISANRNLERYAACRTARRFGCSWGSKRCDDGVGADCAV